MKARGSCKIQVMNQPCIKKLVQHPLLLQHYNKLINF